MNIIMQKAIKPMRSAPVTFAKQIFHSVSYFTRRRRISLKKALPKKCFFSAKEQYNGE